MTVGCVKILKLTYLYLPTDTAAIKAVTFASLMLQKHFRNEWFSEKLFQLHISYNVSLAVYNNNAETSATTTNISNKVNKRLHKSLSYLC